MEYSMMQHLKNDTYCRLKPSHLHTGGVGVFAIKDIPMGVNPFETIYREDDNDVAITEEQVNELPKCVQELVKDFCVPTKDIYTIQNTGFQRLDMSYYLNHCGNPNLRVFSPEESNHYGFKTSRDILAGEELSFDYTEYDDLE